MRFRAALLTFAFTFALPAIAFATEDGDGLAGETDDKLVTFFSLGVMLFFVFVVTLGTIIQSALDRRKDEKKAAKLRQRAGW